MEFLILGRVLGVDAILLLFEGSIGMQYLSSMMRMRRMRSLDLV